VATIVVALFWSSSAFAQRQPSKRRIEVGAGLRWLTGIRFGDVNANEMAFGGANRALFKSTSSFEATPCLEARVASAVTGSLDAEAAVAVGRSHLTTKITEDLEAPNATLTEPVTEYLLEGGVVAHLARRTRRAAPYASAGIGYLRQLHDGHTLVNGGPTAYVGAGVQYAFKENSAAGRRVAGLRAELRGTILTGDLSLDRATHVLPSVIAGVLFHF
jgi:hypothetical protein